MPASSRIQHIFILMLENRSFDHMLGFSKIVGTDAATSEPTTINGLVGTEFNTFSGQPYTVTPGANRVMNCDPAHEFNSVLEQLCGEGATYNPGSAYPAINNSGYVRSYVASGGGQTPVDVMRCFTPDQLPVLTSLAKEFAICDNWHASLPGPTWPNRMFVHAASSGGLDHSPTTAEIIEWETIGGFSFKNGTLFDMLMANGMTRCLYAGDDFPMIAALKGIRLDDIRHYSNFSSDLAQQLTYPYNYVFIEPSYNVLNDYRNSTSQHPLSDIALGESLIKETYEAIRNSTIWNSSVFIVTWDEHGGFYDHAIPPQAIPPGDTAPGAEHNQYGFTFEQYGPRVPAIVVSPLIPKNLIDHRLYDHASIPATVESSFGLRPLTLRDSQANPLDTLLSLTDARDDCPKTLPSPVPGLVSMATAMASNSDLSATAISNPQADVNSGNLPVILQSAIRQNLEIAPGDRDAILRRVSSIKTREQARQYLSEVQQRVRSRKKPGDLGTDQLIPKGLSIF